MEIEVTPSAFEKVVMNCTEMIPDNNLAETAIRPFVLGRKKGLFTRSEEGVRSSCFMYNAMIENENRIDLFLMITSDAFSLCKFWLALTVSKELRQW